MSCPYTPEDLSAYVDGELDSVLTEQIREHVRVCPTCEQEVAWLRDVTGMVRTVPPATPTQATAWKAESLSEREPRRLQCTVVLAQASALIDGELSGDEAADLEAHLYACDPCYRAYRQLTEVADAMQATQPVPAPAGLEQRIWAAIEADQRPVAVARHRVARLFDCSLSGFRCALRLGVAAAFLLLVWSGVWRFIGPYGPPAAVPAASSVAVAPSPTPDATRPAASPRRFALRDRFGLDVPPPVGEAAPAPRWTATDVFSTVANVLDRARRARPTPGRTPVPPAIPRVPESAPPPSPTMAAVPPAVPGPASRSPGVPVWAPPTPPAPGASSFIVSRHVGSGGEAGIAVQPPSGFASGPKSAPPEDRRPLLPPPATRIVERPSEAGEGPDIEVRVERSPAGRLDRPSTAIDRSPLEAERGRIGDTLHTAKRAQPAQWNVPLR